MEYARLELFGREIVDNESVLGLPCIHWCTPARGLGTTILLLCIASRHRPRKVVHAYGYESRKVRCDSEVCYPNGRVTPRVALLPVDVLKSGFSAHSSSLVHCRRFDIPIE